VVGESMNTVTEMVLLRVGARAMCIRIRTYRGYGPSLWKIRYFRCTVR